MSGTRLKPQVDLTSDYQTTADEETRVAPAPNLSAAPLGAGKSPAEIVQNNPPTSKKRRLKPPSARLYPESQANLRHKPMTIPESLTAASTAAPTAEPQTAGTKPSDADLKASTETSHSTEPPTKSGATEAKNATGSKELDALLKALSDAADKGNPEATAKLQKILDQRPEVWKKRGNLNKKAIDAWIGRNSQTMLEAASIRRVTDQLRERLLGRNPTLTQIMLVDEVICCQLALAYAQKSAANTASEGDNKANTFRVLESTQRRYLSALRALEQLQNKPPDGPRPKQKGPEPSGAANAKAARESQSTVSVPQPKESSDVCSKADI